jgi:hypothetical protein
MTPAEDARLLLRLVERHLGSLRGTLDSVGFADEDWGFLAQQTLEKMLKARPRPFPWCKTRGPNALIRG